MPNQYKKINKSNLIQYIIVQKLEEYKKNVFKSILNENILNKNEMDKIKLQLEQEINLKIYYELNKLKF